MHGTVVRSPRGTGTFEFEPVPNALEDAGVRELASKDRAAALERIANGAVETFAPLITRPFDWARWSSDGIVGCAYTVVWGVQQGSSSPMVQRDWYLVLESDFANPHLVLASFRGNDPAAAPVDIFDCEEMVRTIRFET